MVKRLLSIVTLLAVCFGLSAQVTFGKAQLPAAYTQNHVLKAPARAQGTMSFTYYPGGDITNVNYIDGTGKTSTYNIAMFIPAKFAGKTISKISFILYDTSVLTNISAWESAALPASADAADVKADNVVAKSISSTSITPSTATFNTPITVPSTGCYVGYSFRVTKATTQAGQYPVFIGQLDDPVENAVMVNYGSGWEDYGAQGVAVALSADIAGDYNENSVSISSVGSSAVLPGNKTTINVAFSNDGLKSVSKLAYTVKDLASGTTSDEKTVSVSSVKAMATGSFSFTLDAQNEVSEVGKEIAITKVNGVANEATTGNVKEFKVVTMSKSYTRKVVEEEATATGCSYCSRGYAGMKYLHDTYPDTWIGIAAHTVGVNWYDPMYCPDYTDITSQASGIPAAWLDRTASVDPYFGSSNSTLLGIDADFKKAAAVPSEASVKVNAKFDEAKNIININTDVEFSINSTTSNYGIAYVLLANGLKKPANSPSNYEWYQYDGYYGQKGAESEPYIYEWCKGDGVEYITIQGNKVAVKKDMVYDHVAIAASDILNGVDGSITLPIVDGQTQHHSYSFDISKGIKSLTIQDDAKNGDDLIQDKDALEVVAILINRGTGAIVNADKVALGTPAGINNAVTDSNSSSEVARYSLDGVRLSAPQKGLNIVKLSDGRTVKVMVK